MSGYVPQRFKVYFYSSFFSLNPLRQKSLVCRRMKLPVEICCGPQDYTVRFQLTIQKTNPPEICVMMAKKSDARRLEYCLLNNVCSCCGSLVTSQRPPLIVRLNTNLQQCINQCLGTIFPVYWYMECLFPTVQCGVKVSSAIKTFVFIAKSIL